MIVDSVEDLLVSGRTRDPAALLSARLGALKSLAVAIEAPVLATAPVSRIADLRSDMRPHLSDLEHFSETANESIDLMISLYRDEVYNQDGADKGTMEVIVDKTRHWDRGIARLPFKWETLSFG